MIMMMKKLDDIPGMAVRKVVVMQKCKNAK